MPHAEAYWLDGCSHMLAVEAPYSIYRLLMRFWGRHGTTARPMPSWLDSILPPPGSIPISKESGAPPSESRELSRLKTIG